MEDLTFGEQVKIILGRKGMTIKELAEIIEECTGKKMSRQNLTQRLGRDNFQEKDMRTIADILGCTFQLSILADETKQVNEGSDSEAVPTEQEWKKIEKKRQQKAEEKTVPDKMPAEQIVEPAETEQIVENTVTEQTVEPAMADQVGEPSEEESVTMPSAEPSEEEPVTMPSAEPVEEESATMPSAEPARTSSEQEDERDMTIGELYEIHEELSEMEEDAKTLQTSEADIDAGKTEPVRKGKKEKFRTGGIFLRRKVNTPQENKKEEQTETTNTVEAKPDKETANSKEVLKYAAPQESDLDDFEPVVRLDNVEEDLAKGEENPYTGHEYLSNSVRMHPSRIGYVQVYDRAVHGWTDMTEWAFLGYQERKKALLGKAYDPPIYLD